MKIRLELRVAKAIQKKVAYCNGWNSKERLYSSCLRAARNVIRMVRADDKKKREAV